MNYLFELNHPKHYHQFKFIIANIRREGHSVFVIARDKDILLTLLNEDSVKYQIFGKHKKTVLSKILNTFSLVVNYISIVRKNKIDIIVSKASFYGCFVAKVMRKKSIIFPDSEIVKVTNKFVVPLATQIVTPLSFTLNYGKKHIKVNSFFENCYLSPQVFSPNREVIEKLNIQFPYVVLRFIGWTANHDINNFGFSKDEKMKLVEKLKSQYKIYISSEHPLPNELEAYLLKIPSKDIHHLLHFADLYIGDSQTMATEAALLGTPAIRYNSFVGGNDMSNFKILEEKYQMLSNFNSFDALMKLVSKYCDNSEKKQWLLKREDYNKKTGDLNQQITKIILDL